MNLSKGFLLAIIVVFGVLSLMLVLPFVQYILFAVLLAYLLYPLYEFLDARIGERLSAFTTLLIAITGFLLPTWLIAGVIASDAARIAQEINPETLQIQEIESTIQETFGVNVDLTGALTDSGQEIGMMAVQRSTELFSTITHMLIGIGVAIFLVYYFLKDGDKLLAWMRETTPLPDEVQDDLYDEIDGVMGAVIVGHVLIALIQGAIAGIGLFATGVPNAPFWTVIMIVLSLLPIVGSFLVWGPAVGYLVLTGQPIFAVGLFVYCLIVVSLSDDYLRPIVVDRYAELSPAVIILGVLGGVYAFGVMGLFFGPVVLGALKATLSVLNEHYQRLEAVGD